MRRENGEIEARRENERENAIGQMVQHDGPTSDSVETLGERKNREAGNAHNHRERQISQMSLSIQSFGHRESTRNAKSVRTMNLGQSCLTRNWVTPVCPRFHAALRYRRSAVSYIVQSLAKHTHIHIQHARMLSPYAHFVSIA